MTKFERQRRCLLVTIAVLSLILTSLCGYVYAKYVKVETLGGSVTIKAEIGTVLLQEHVAERQTDGSYTLTEEIAATGNKYTLIPGLDVPKDPHIVVTKPNNLPVYIYIKVDTNITEESGVVYKLADCWKPVDAVNLPGVYVYSSETGPISVTDDIAKLDILQKPENSKYEIRVDQGLNVTGEVFLNFQAYMYQNNVDNDPEAEDAQAVYAHYNSSSE